MIHTLLRFAGVAAAALALLPGLVLHAADRRFRAEVEAVLRYGAALDAFARR